MTVILKRVVGLSVILLLSMVLHSVDSSKIGSTAEIELVIPEVYREKFEYYIEDKKKKKRS